MGAAAAGVNTGVIINLFLPNVATGTVNGEVARGTITNANNANVSLDSLRTLFNNGNAYVERPHIREPGWRDPRPDPPQQLGSRVR